jgi:hypothetical protein
MIGGVVCVIRSIWGVLQYAVDNIVTPLSTNITQLQETTKELKTLVNFLKDNQQELDKRLMIVEQAVKAEHKRLDELVQFCRDLNVGNNHSILDVH